MKRVTLAEVAERAGVSVMTASYTYNRPERVSDRSRSKVLAAAAELKYPGPDPSARSLRRGSTRTLGIVMGEHLTYAFEDPQAVSFLAGIADVCAARGYGMTILPITGAAEDASRITSAAVDGFIVWTTSDDDPVMAAVQSMKRPAVVHGGPAVARAGAGEHRQPGGGPRGGRRRVRGRPAACGGEPAAVARTGQHGSAAARTSPTSCSR